MRYLRGPQLRYRALDDDPRLVVLPKSEQGISQSESCQTGIFMHPETRKVCQTPFEFRGRLRMVPLFNEHSAHTHRCSSYFTGQATPHPIARPRHEE